MIIDAVILAGGRASRMGGANKGATRIGDTTFLDTAISAVSVARAVCVVGPVEVPAGVAVTQEDPPLSGPVAGLAAGLAALPAGADAVIALACDMPFAPEIVPTLASELSAAVDGVWALDADGRAQPLLAIYRRVSLDAALGRLGPPAGASMRRLTAEFDMTEVSAPRAAQDADTWNDVERLRKEWK